MRAPKRARGPRSGDTRDTNALAQEAKLADVASRYYVDRLTQEEIARQIGRSVATVSRLLARAEAAEIVEVSVRYPVPVVPALQAALVKRFGLRTARVARISSDVSQSLLAQISSLGARYISTILSDGAVFAVTSGTTVHAVVDVIPPAQLRDVHVVQGVGSLGSRLPTIDNPLVIQVLAERIGATPHYLPAPMIVESAAVRDALCRDPHFKATLELGSRADIVLVGIGPAEAERSAIVRAGYLPPWKMDRIQASGGVGDMMVEFFDISGRILETDFRHRIVGMREAELRNARTVVAVAGGVAKAPAILGALRTGMIHTLVTDDVTAKLVLELDETRRPRQAGANAPEGDDHARGGVPKAPQLSPHVVPAEVPRISVSPPSRPGLASILRSVLIDMAYRADGEQFADGADGHTRSETAWPGLEALLQQRWRRSLIDAVIGEQERGELVSDLSPTVVADLLLGAIAFRLRTSAMPPDPGFHRDLLSVFAKRGA